MSADGGRLVRAGALAALCALAVSFAVLPVHADWGALTEEGEKKAAEADGGSDARARALRELRRVRALLRSLQDEIAESPFDRSPSVDEVRADVLADQVDSIMNDPPPDATEGLKKVREISAGALEDLKAIEEAGTGPANLGWSEDIEQ